MLAVDSALGQALGHNEPLLSQMHSSSSTRHGFGLLQFGRLVAALLLSSALTAGAARTSPSPISGPVPIYPPALAEEGKVGTVTVEFSVGLDGRTRDPVVKSSDDPAFTAAALTALEAWTFRPGTKDGEPVEMRVALPFQFKPSPADQLNRLLKRKVFTELNAEIIEVKDLGERPKPTKRVKPMYPRSKQGSNEDVTVRVRFVIGPDGLTYNPEVLSEPPADFVVPALITVSGMQFKPVLKDGKPVYVRMTMPLKFTEFQPEPTSSPSGGGGAGGGGGGGGGGDGGGDGG